MKKGISLVLVLVMSGSFAACSSAPFYGADYDKAYDTGTDNQIYEYEQSKEIYDEGYSDGYSDGRDSAFDDYYLEDYEWMTKNVIFTTSEKDYYHRVYCEDISDCDIWVDFVEGAESNGYIKCPKCCIDPEIKKITNN